MVQKISFRDKQEIISEKKRPPPPLAGMPHANARKVHIRRELDSITTEGDARAQFSRFYAFTREHHVPVRAKIEEIGLTKCWRVRGCDFQQVFGNRPGILDHMVLCNGTPVNSGVLQLLLGI